MNDRQTKTEWLFKHMPDPALYELLAEECAELAHAALKMARLLRDENPVSEAENYYFLKDNLKEEFTDIALVADVLDLRASSDIYNKKLDRWLERMNYAGSTQ